MIRVAFLFLLLASAAFAGPSTVVRVQGSIDGFDKNRVSVRTSTGYRIILTREAFPRWFHMEPGIKVSIQVPRIMVLGTQKAI